jgi:hypothetical protein
MKYPSGSEKEIDVNSERERDISGGETQAAK